ncbi:hypothetical protein GCM10008018_72080 [Paenibacillus marchantiophytorum]|uniref:Secreted protein n=1 Tax=Paenibacillus marchantiophytorum TaxID=1619310 RepID=A0ABQ1FIV2_9BACL|nr:hypothetical protein GCM10008018_72080 [Paenibacillus marchantiophytorum]
MFVGVGPVFVCCVPSIVVALLNLTVSLLTLLSGVLDSAIPFSIDVSSGTGGGELNPPVRIGGV